MDQDRFEYLKAKAKDILDKRVKKFPYDILGELLDEYQTRLDALEADKKREEIIDSAW